MDTSLTLSMTSKPCFCRSALACLCGSAGFFERSAKSLFGLRLCARLGLAFLPCSAVRCHFEPFAKRRKIHALRCNLHFKFMDTSLSLSMTNSSKRQKLVVCARLGFWANLALLARLGFLARLLAVILSLL